jgi:hypothetical protein
LGLKSAHHSGGQIIETGFFHNQSAELRRNTGTNPSSGAADHASGSCLNRLPASCDFGRRVHTRFWNGCGQHHQLFDRRRQRAGNSSPLVGVAASAVAAQGTSAGADASLNYDFEVVGGNPGDSVPVLITANLVTIANSTSTAYASIFVAPGEQSLGGTQVVACTNETLCTQPAAFFGTFTVSSPGASTHSDLRSLRVN